MILCLVMQAAPATAADEELKASRERLDQIQQQISKTLKGLRGKQSESGMLLEDLDRLDEETRRIERLDKKSKRQLAELTGRLEKQRRELSQIEEQRSATERQIRHRLVILYKTGEVGLIKALLSETESPRDIAEKYAFLSRMVRHDRELLALYRQQTEEQRAAVSELEALRKEQSTVVLRRSKEQQVLKKAQDSKKNLLGRGETGY